MICTVIICNEPACLAVYLPEVDGGADVMERAARMRGWRRVSTYNHHCPACATGRGPVLERGTCPTCCGRTTDRPNEAECHYCHTTTPHPADDDQDDDDLEAMHAAYEEIDAAEYAEFNAEMDARDAEWAARQAEREARCPAAHPEDPTPCAGPLAVTVLDRQGGGADGCEHHGARLLASLDGARVYGLPEAGAAAVRVFKAAAALPPYAWRTEGDARA